MDMDTESKGQSCSMCQESQKASTVATLHPWEWPDKTWRRIHIVYPGRSLFSTGGCTWENTYPINTSTHNTTIERLRTSFRIYGLHEMLVSDNGRFHKHGIPKVYEAKQHSTCCINALSSIIKWVS